MRDMTKIKNLIVPFLLFGIALTACAPKTRTVKIDDQRVEAEAKIQRGIVLTSTKKKKLRLQDIAYPLLVSGVPFCGENIKPVLGMIFANKFSFDKAYQDIAAQHYGMGENFKIFDIYTTSPAEEAGLRIGDTVKEINRQRIVAGEHGAEKLTEQLRGQLDVDRPIQITIARNGQELIFDVTAELACNYPVMLVKSDDINAFADGQMVGITQGMMSFVEQEQELSLVIAHELAHNAMGHISSQRGNSLLGTILDLAVGTTTGISTYGLFSNVANWAYSQDFEKEADYVGLYIMANAGQEIEGAAQFWRRLAATNPDGIKKGFMASHPSTPERFLAIEETAKEIKRKSQAGLPLRPEMK